MTEEEWLECTYPSKMLAFLRDKGGERKQRLFAVACCYRIWHLLTDTQSRAAVEVAERYADGLADSGQLEVAGRRAGWVAAWAGHADAAEAAAWAAADLTVAHWPETAAARARCAEGADATRCLPQCAVLRDIFGNPFRPVAFDPNWRTPSVTAVAHAIYSQRRFEDLPILADALEEAGCTSADILSHCRLGGEHVRGCWVVDLVLGKE